jgi:hypothetical protein
MFYIRYELVYLAADEKKKKKKRKKPKKKFAQSEARTTWAMSLQDIISIIRAKAWETGRPPLPNRKQRRNELIPPTAFAVYDASRYGETFPIFASGVLELAELKQRLAEFFKALQLNETAKIVKFLNTNLGHYYHVRII